MGRMNRFMRNGRSIILAYDQGIEHGPTDFDGRNVDPKFVIDIANKGGFDAFACQKGIAEKYHEMIEIPLLIKLNAKTNIYGKEPVAKQLCSVDYASRLGAAAVGYTIYIGSEFEGDMVQEFGKIEEEAHGAGLAVVLWVYPRGEYVKDDTARDMVAYAARAALEFGADAAKVKYTGDKESFSWVVKSAGNVPVYMAGGKKTKNESEFLTHVSGALDAGAAGIAVGRNVWQSSDPLRTAKVLNELIIERKSPEKVTKTA